MKNLGVIESSTNIISSCHGYQHSISQFSSHRKRKLNFSPFLFLSFFSWSTMAERQHLIIVSGRWTTSSASWAKEKNNCRPTTTSSDQRREKEKDTLVNGRREKRKILLIRSCSFACLCKIDRSLSFPFTPSVIFGVRRRVSPLNWMKLQQRNNEWRRITSSIVRLSRFLRGESRWLSNINFSWNDQSERKSRSSQRSEWNFDQTSSNRFDRTLQSHRHRSLSLGTVIVTPGTDEFYNSTINLANAQVIKTESTLPNTIQYFNGNANQFNSNNQQQTFTFDNIVYNTGKNAVDRIDEYSVKDQHSSCDNSTDLQRSTSQSSDDQ